MNLLGRIFVVLNFVFSLVFMTLAVGVWSINRNYADAVKQKSTQLSAAQASVNDLTATQSRLQQELNAEQAVRQMMVARLAGDLQQTQQEAQNLGQQLTGVQQQATNAIASLTAQSARIDNWVGELTKSRGSLQSAYEQRDDLWQQAREKTDLAAQKELELQAVQAANDELQRQVARMSNLLRSRNIDPGEDATALVEGRINEVRDRYVVVSVGRDDGVKVGDQLEVVRGGRYIGRLRVISSDPDQALCLILREFQKGVMQGGDDVRTQLKVG